MASRRVIRNSKYHNEYKKLTQISDKFFPRSFKTLKPNNYCIYPLYDEFRVSNFKTHIDATESLFDPTPTLNSERKQEIIDLITNNIYEKFIIDCQMGCHLGITARFSASHTRQFAEKIFYFKYAPEIIEMFIELRMYIISNRIKFFRSSCCDEHIPVKYFTKDIPPHCLICTFVSRFYKPSDKKWVELDRDFFEGIEWTQHYLKMYSTIYYNKEYLMKSLIHKKVTYCDFKKYKNHNKDLLKLVINTFEMDYIQNCEKYDFEELNEKVQLLYFLLHVTSYLFLDLTNILDFPADPKDMIMIRKLRSDIFAMCNCLPVIPLESKDNPSKSFRYAETDSE